MAAPIKMGLDYFPLEVGFLADDKIKIVKSRFSLDGVMFYIYLLCKIYKEGYFIRLENDYDYLMSDDLGMNSRNISQMINFFAKKELFDNTLFREERVLTSVGIQKRYQEALKNRGSKRPIQVNGKYWVVNSGETLGFIKVNLNENNDDNNPSNYDNNPSNYDNNPSKEKKRKEKNNIANVSCKHSTKNQEDIFLTIPLNTGEYYFSKSLIAEYEVLYPAVDVEQELRKYKAWAISNPTKRKTAKGILKSINAWLSTAQDNGRGRLREGEKKKQVEYLNV